MLSSTLLRAGNSTDLGRAIENTLNNISRYGFQLISTQVVINKYVYYCLVVYDTNKEDV